jgi:hypothetical protein
MAYYKHESCPVFLNKSSANNAGEPLVQMFAVVSYHQN